MFWKDTLRIRSHHFTALIRISALRIAIAESCADSSVETDGTLITVGWDILR